MRHLRGVAYRPESTAPPARPLSPGVKAESPVTANACYPVHIESNEHMTYHPRK
jgi:hypothetical protein